MHIFMRKPFYAYSWMNPGPWNLERTKKWMCTNWNILALPNHEVTWKCSLRVRLIGILVTQKIVRIQCIGCMCMFHANVTLSIHWQTYVFNTYILWPYRNTMRTLTAVKHPAPNVLPLLSRIHLVIQHDGLINRQLLQHSPRFLVMFIHVFYYCVVTSHVCHLLRECDLYVLSVSFPATCSLL